MKAEESRSVERMSLSVILFSFWIPELDFEQYAIQFECVTVLFSLELYMWCGIYICKWDGSFNSDEDGLRSKAAQSFVEFHFESWTDLDILF
jgi:hypothetical protein